MGVNIHTEEGRELVQDFNIPGAPYISILFFDDNGILQNIGSRYAEEINVNSLFEMCDTAYDMMSSFFSPEEGISEFNVADSRLNIVETEEAKNEIADNLQNRNTTGFVETRRREPQIDPNTGIPVGMTEQQYADKLIRDQQMKELEEAKEADRRKLEEHRNKQQQDKLRQKQELEDKQKQEEQLKEREERAQQIRKNLPDEPAEDNPDACTIQFRLPDGSEAAPRRFLKTDKVELLYDYVYSLGIGQGFETHHGHFQILQNFPKKIFDDMDATLQSQGLFPRSKVYVREQSHE